MKVNFAALAMSALVNTSELTVNDLLGAVATLGILHVLVWPFAIAAPMAMLGIGASTYRGSLPPWRDAQPVPSSCEPLTA